MSTLDGVWPKASRNNLYFMNTPNRGGEAGTGTQDSWGQGTVINIPEISRFQVCEK